MSVHSRQLDDPSGILYVLTGDTSAKDLIGISDDIRANEDRVFAILDFSNTTLNNLSLTDIHQIAIKDTSFPETHSFEKLALVGLSGAGRWLAESYKFFTESWIMKRNDYETRLFDELDEAAAWLNTSISE